MRSLGDVWWGVVLAAASSGCAQAPAVRVASDAEDKVHPDLAALRADSGWLLPAGECPADVAADEGVKGDWLAQQCGGDLRKCVWRCRENDPTACYAAAVRVQELKDEQLSDALFLRACRLGSNTACTARAASVMDEEQRSDHAACATRTFALMCDRAETWACAMFGRALAAGDGVAADAGRAREVLPKACAADETDPACVGARKILRELDETGPAPAAPAPTAPAAL